MQSAQLCGRSRFSYTGAVWEVPSQVTCKIEDLWLDSFPHSPRTDNRHNYLIIYKELNEFYLHVKR